MAPILRIKSRWSGFNGAPGYTVMHFRDFGTGEGGSGDVTETQAEAAITRTGTFWQGLQLVLPQNVQVTVEPEVDVIEAASGDLVDSYTIGVPLTYTGTLAGPYSAASGAVINWRTAGVRNSRRVRGRTFLVPISASCYTDDGDLTFEARGRIQTQADGLVDPTGVADLGVYARPTSETADDGEWFAARAATVPSMAAILRSRRD